MQQAKLVVPDVTKDACLRDKCEVKPKKCMLKQCVKNEKKKQRNEIRKWMKNEKKKKSACVKMKYTNHNKKTKNKH